MGTGAAGRGLAGEGGLARLASAGIPLRVVAELCSPGRDREERGDRERREKSNCVLLKFSPKFALKLEKV